MNLLHLIAHDIRSNRWLLAACAVIAAADAWLVTSVPQGYGQYRLLGWNLQYALPLARIVMPLLATGFILQQDSLVGTSAFWRTRPIGRHVMLTSKTLTLGLVLVVWPAMLQWVAWYRLGLYAGDASVVATGAAINNATVVLLTAMAAVVTPSFTYLVIAGVAGGTMVTLLNGYVLPTIVASWPFVGQTLRGYRPALYLGTLFLLGVPAVAYQFLRMKDWHTASFVAVALLSATLVTRFWPAQAVGVSFLPVDPKVVDTQTVNVTIGERAGRWEAPVVDYGLPRQAGRGGARPAPTFTQMAHYSAQISAEGQPDGIKLWIDRFETRLLLRDKTAVTTTRNVGVAMPPTVTPETNPHYLSLAAAVAPARLRPPVGTSFTPPREGTTIARIRLDAEQAHQGERAVLTAKFDIIAYRSHIVGTMPATVGARIRVARGAVEIMSLRTNGTKVTMRTRAALVAPDDNYTVMNMGFHRNLVFRHRGRGEAIQLRSGRAWPYVGAYTPAFYASNLRGSAFEIEFECVPPPGVALDAAWLAGAEVVAFEDEPIGTFTKSVQTTLTLGGE